MQRRTTKFDLSKGCYHVPNHDWIIVLEQKLDRATKIGAFCKKHEIFKTEHTLNDFIAFLVVDRVDSIVVIYDDRLLITEITFTCQDELIAYVLDFYTFCNVMHIATYLLKVHAWQVDHRIELRVIDGDLLIVKIQKVEFVCRLAVLLTVFDLDAEMIDISGLYEQCESIVGIDRTNQLVKVQHVDTDRDFALALIILKLTSIQFQMCQHAMRCVHGYDLHTRVIKLDTRIRQQLFESLDQYLECLTLDSFDFKNIRRNFFHFNTCPL
jgi:hypothetical protein